MFYPIIIAKLEAKRKKEHAFMAVFLLGHVDPNMQSVVTRNVLDFHSCGRPFPPTLTLTSPHTFLTFQFPYLNQNRTLQSD